MPVEVSVCYATTGKQIDKFKPSIDTSEIAIYKYLCQYHKLVQPLLDMIMPKLKHKNSFYIISDGQIIYNHLKNDLKQLGKYIFNIYYKINHTLYIVIEEYYDDKNRSLAEYKYYLEHLSYENCNEIARSHKLSICNKYLIFNIIKFYPSLFLVLNNDLKNNKEIVLEAVTTWGYLLQYASKELQKDREIVLAAITQCGTSLQFASEEFKKDKKIVLIAVNKSGYALQYASKELRNDKEIVLAAFKQNCYALKYASKELQNDKEIILA